MYTIYFRKWVFSQKIRKNPFIWVEEEEKSRKYIWNAIAAVLTTNSEKEYFIVYSVCSILFTKRFNVYSFSYNLNSKDSKRQLNSMEFFPASLWTWMRA